MPALLDANVIAAFHNAADPRHKAARDLLEHAEERFGPVYISDYVFDESLTVTLARSKRLDAAIRLGESLLASEFSLIRLTDEVLSASWEFFRKRNPGGMSFTDCTLAALAEMLGDTAILTFDKEFAKVPGLRVVS